MDHIVKILEAQNILYNVKQFTVEKPEGFKFKPGQAIDLTINQDGWKDKKNLFTFTSLNEHPHLQFTIKIYEDSKEGVTKHLSELKPGDELIISDPWGTIEYRGPGYFIAGGAGITPFIAIFRELNKRGEAKGNKLFFSNKTQNDIIIQNELKIILGDNVIFTTTEDKKTEGEHRRINEKFLKAEVDDFSKHFYVCGPDKMVHQISKTLEKLGAKADSVVFEQYINFLK
jgi:ferredoxin-NADP reductase